MQFQYQCLFDLHICSRYCTGHHSFLVCGKVFMAYLSTDTSNLFTSVQALFDHVLGCVNFVRVDLVVTEAEDVW